MIIEEILLHLLVDVEGLSRSIRLSIEAGGVLDHLPDNRLLTTVQLSLSEHLSKFLLDGLSFANTYAVSPWFQSKVLHVYFDHTYTDRSVLFFCF